MVMALYGIRAGGMQLSAAAVMLTGSGISFVAATALFFALPGMDIDIARLFFAPHVGFDSRALVYEVPRYAMQVLYGGALLAAVIASVRYFVTRRSWLGLSGAKWMFVALALMIGPGLVANVLLKDQSGRARPRQVEMFGGDKVFTPPLVPAQQCRRNCSFVSGEASSMFALLFALALVMRTWFVRLVWTGIAIGALAGLIRMAQGAHFLSDIVFAGVFMAATVAGLHLMMFVLGPDVLQRIRARFDAVSTASQRA